MSDNKAKPNSVSFGKVFLLFLLIFVFATYYISFQISSKMEEENEKQIESYMASQLDSYISESSAEGYVWNKLQKVIDTAIKDGIDSKQLAQAISDFKSKYHISANFFFYVNNEFTKGFNYNNKDLLLFKDYLKLLVYKKGKLNYNNQDKTNLDGIQKYFGAGNRLEYLIISKGYLKSYPYQETKQFYYWNNFPDGTGIFFYTTQIPEFINRLNIVLSEKTNDKIGAIDSTNKKIISPKNFLDDQTLSAYIKATKLSKPFVESNDCYWYFQTSKTSNKICYSVPKDLNINSFYNWADLSEKLSLNLLILLIVIFITSYLKVFPGKNTINFLDNLSIKYRIMGIICMSSVFPAIMSLIFGFSLLSDKEKVIEEAILSESLAGIKNIENQFIILKNRLHKLALELREDVKHKKFTEELFKEYLKKYSLSTELSYLEIRDGDINTLLTMHDRETSGIPESMDLITRIVLKLHSPSRLNQTKLNISPAELISETVLSRDEVGFSTLLRQRDKQWVLQAGNSPTIWYWDVYPEIATGPAFMGFTSITGACYKELIQDYFKNPLLSSDSLQLYAYISDDLYYPEILPDKYNNIPKKHLFDIANSSLITNKALFRTVSINGKLYWVTAKKERNVGCHVYLHLINQEERLKVLNPYKWRILLSSILTLLISLFGAWFIISLVILPVNNLNQGIEAIRYRIRDFTIPVTRKDELGKLAIAFNKVIKEFDEMDYGKVVQESLLPSSSPQIEGYDIAYFKISASDLAGDYHDHAILEDGKLAIILGDVSGHGISASLAMAMAKATFDYAQSLKVKFPEDFMDMLNTMFNKELKPRNKLMTMISMKLTPETGEVVFDNSGQAYPCYYSASSQTSEELKMPSLPIGGMKKRKKKPIVKQMEKGDAFIFYTDGIIEASSAKGEMFGYERFFAKFTEQMKKNISSKEAIRNIFDEVEKFREPGHHSDDITLIIVRRNP